MPDERKTEDTTSPPKTHEVAPVVNNEITADREANDAASPTKVERLRQWYKANMEPRAPSPAVLKWVALALSIALILVIMGIAIGFSTMKMQESSTYNLQVQDNGKQIFEKVQIFNDIAMFWTPKHDGIARCTTIHDFKTGWTGIHDEDHDICFVRPLNNTNFPSLDLLKQTVSAQRRVLKFSPILDTRWEVQIMSESRIDHLSFMLHWKCTSRGRKTYLMVPTKYAVKMNPTVDSCESVCLPHYGLVNTTADGHPHFDMPSKDCFKHSVC